MPKYICIHVYVIEKKNEIFTQFLFYFLFIKIKNIYTMKFTVHKHTRGGIIKIQLVHVI